MSAPRISIVLPTFQGERDLARLLPALASQVVEGGVEVLAVDSSSTDGSVARLEASGADVVVIPQAEFRHGATRTRRARDASGELLVFLTQDAVPARSDFLVKLTEPFADARIQGTWARILPHGDDDPLTARTALSQPEASDRSREVSADREAPERDSDIDFNNVASAIRRSFFAQHPFPEVAFGEDQAWAVEAVRAGARLKFCADAVVYHAHRYSVRQAFERNRVDAAFQRRQHGRVVRPHVGSVLKGLAHELWCDLRYVLGERPSGVLHLFRAPFLRGAQVLGQYFGSHGWNPGPRGEEATRALS